MKGKNNFNDKLCYHNDMNKFIFKDFSQIDFNLFFTICFYAKEQKNEGDFIVLHFNLLKQFVVNDRNKKRFYEKIVFFVKKLNVLKAENHFISDNGFRKYVITSFFDRIEVDEENEFLRFKINKEVLYLIYEVFDRYTILDMHIFCNIPNKYAKNLFRFLKQWENSKPDECGKATFRISYNNFLLLFDVPEGYTSSKVEHKVIKPCIQILSNKYFNNLTYEKIKVKGKGQGGQIKEIVFKFDSNYKSKAL